MAKESKDYFCPYCGNSYNDTNWSYDHIIPRQMGGPKKFKIIACTDCNHKISREIEQPTLKSSDWNRNLAKMFSEGYKIKTRRKKVFIHLDKGAYIPLKGPVNVDFDIKNKKHRLIFPTSDHENDKWLPSSAVLVDVVHDANSKELKLVFRGNTNTRDKEGKSFVVAIPAEEECKANDTVLCKLANKIILGACSWVWGEKFSKSFYADLLRQRIFDVDSEIILPMRPGEHHATIVIEETDNGELREEDLFDNSPDNTIVISASDGIFWGFVNLSGFESLNRVCDLNPAITLEGLNDGVVIIASSTQNKVQTMNLNEYKDFKIREFEGT